MLEAIPASTAAERVLFFLQNYEQGYGRDIAATFDMAQSQVRKQPEKFESGGILVSRRGPDTSLSVEPPEGLYVSRDQS